MAHLFGAGSGGMEAAAAAAAANGADDDGQVIDLADKIDSKECYARNENSRFPMTNLFIGDSRLGCQSDSDEQLIIHIAFHEFVKIKSIKLTAYNNGQDPELNPAKINLYVNRDNLGFEDAEDVDPTQTLHITSEDLRETADPIPLKYVKYQRVSSLTLFIEENQGGDVSALGSLKLYGRPVTTTNMADFKKNPHAGEG
jgi:PITH domain